LILFLFETEISCKQKEEILEKEILELKGRLRDLEDELKKSRNMSYDNLGTRKRLIISSRRIIEDDESHHDTNEQRNEEQTQVDNKYSEPLFPAHHESQFLPSNPGSPPRRVESTTNEEVRKCHVWYMRCFLT
jgi:hypothetical protein